MITSNSTFICTCPCCGKPTILKLIKGDDGQHLVSFSHTVQEADYSDVVNLGYEFGMKEGGEEDGQR